MPQVRSTAASLLTRAGVALALGLAAVFGSFIAGSFRVGTAASAAVPTSVFYGYVLADGKAPLPERVSALGAKGAVCGSAVVIAISDSVGIYVLSIVSGDKKPGCPPAKGGVVQFALLSGRLDDGIRAEQVGTLSGAPQALNLRSAASIIPNWSGTPGNVEGGSLLRWTGIDAPLEAALSTLPFAVGDLYYLDPVSGMFAKFTSLDLVLRTGDLLFAHFR